MRKAYVGVRIRRLREDRNMKQVELAAALGISASYLNQIEQNQRPLTVPVLLRMNALFDVDVQLFSDDDEARLVTDMREALSDGPETLSQIEIRELAMNSPALSRNIVALFRRYRETVERNEAMAAQLGDEWINGGAARAPFEQVRDFFYQRRNHVAVLDEFAERLYVDARLTPDTANTGLAQWLANQFNVEVVVGGADDTERRYDEGNRKVYLSPDLSPGQQAFQMATQIAFLQLDRELEDIASDPILTDAAARRLARVGLANYFAGAVVLPYQRFLSAAESEAYDIERLERRFKVGFETICHRLSTLQRPGAHGVPFFFVRVDRAGNISKRQSATDFHFSRVGGSCPLWNVYESFAQPGKILTQIASMPDGRSYLWIARTVVGAQSSYGAPRKTFAIGIGCDIRHAERLVYSRGLNLRDPAAATPIGAGCKVCERPDCQQRAFPPVGRALLIDETRSSVIPYPTA